MKISIVGLILLGTMTQNIPFYLEIHPSSLLILGCGLVRHLANLSWTSYGLMAEPRLLVSKRQAAMNVEFYLLYLFDLSSIFFLYFIGHHLCCYLDHEPSDCYALLPPLCSSSPPLFFRLIKKTYVLFFFLTLIISLSLYTHMCVSACVLDWP